MIILNYYNINTWIQNKKSRYYTSIKGGHEVKNH